VSRREKYDRIDPVDADLLWSAAQAAYRINNGYLKQPDRVGDQIVRPTNREVVTILLHDQSMITDADRELAKECRKFMTHAATLNMLKGTITEWGEITAKVCQLDRITSNYDMAVITAMPQALAKAKKREAIDARLARTQEGGLKAKLGDKVELAVEIIRNNYSAKFNTWFISAITNDNYAIFFAYREKLETETHVTIRGTVKRHNDRATQLNRVKLVEEPK
jgi:2-oxo-4-hydroxy-4-carboxy--5-ureidoimidazoline (OHCU) decarboxylase